MPQISMDRDGTFRFPEPFLARRQLPSDLAFWLDQRDDTFILLPRLLNLHKLYLEPTTVCNLNCRTCIRNIWQDPQAHMEMATFDLLLEQMSAFPDLERVVLSGHGEALTHPEILEMVRRVREQNLAVTLGTNGLLLDEAVSQELVALGVDRLVVSLDGVRPETYAGVRGARLARVLDNIRGLNEAKREAGSLLPMLSIEFVALKRNIGELPHLSSLASKLGAERVLVSNVLAYTDEMRQEILYGYEPRRPLESSSWPVWRDAWVTWGTLYLPRMHWGAEQRCRFVQDRSTVVGWDGGVTPCYGLSHSYSYLTIDGRRKQVERYVLGNVTRESLLEIWTSEDYCRFRNEVRDFHFPSCPDCDLRDTCDLRERNEGCWGWNPSCADCLWAQDIVRCP